MTRQRSLFTTRERAANTDASAEPAPGRRERGVDTQASHPAPRPVPWWWVPIIMFLALELVLALTKATGPLLPLQGTLESWASITVAVVLQAMPFLVLGVLLSGVISAFIPESFLRRITPRNHFFAVPATATAGFFLPGCECASVPVSQSLMRRGVPPAAALAFLLASPAINPVVLVSTAVAFTGNPMMSIARFAASLLAAIFVGWCWVSFGSNIPMDGDAAHVHHGANKWELFRASALHDLMNAGGFLALGAMIASLIKVAVPKAWFQTLNDYPLAALLVMAALAVLLSLCSEADGFIAASFTHVSPTAQLVFLTVGPMIDLKLMAMQYGAWGRRFVTLFVPITLVASILMAAIVGGVVFGSL